MSRMRSGHGGPASPATVLSTDGDVAVFFRKSDVIAVGGLIRDVTYPVINLEEGGSLQGSVDALNRVLDLTVAAWRRQGGTFVIPR